VHHCDSCRRRDQFDVTSYYVSFHFFYDQHVSNINTSIIRTPRLFYCITNKMQQIPFIDPFKSALHVSGDKLAHPQEQFWPYIQLLVQWPCHRSPAISVHCTKAVYTVKKCSWGWANLSPETCRADLNRSIKRSINGICCILVSYIIVCKIDL